MVSSTTYTDYQHAVIHFSEPMKSLGSTSVSNSNVTVGTLSADGMSVPVDLSAAAEGAYSVTLVGATIRAITLLLPNPVLVLYQKINLIQLHQKLLE